MAQRTHTIASPIAPPAKSGLFARVGAAYGRWVAALRLREELGRLSSRELADMGIGPGDIRTILRARRPD